MRLAERTQMWEAIASRLAPRDRELLARRFGVGGHDVQSPREIAVAMGLHAGSVRQMVYMALARARAVAEEIG